MKTDLWDRLGKTDPKHTKQFKRAGGFSGTAIKPMWAFRRMTEEFGPCGIGWGVDKPEFQVVQAGEETLVYCTVSIWYENANGHVFGVGGDKVAGKNKYGLSTDDEAFKKAYTDALSNALKLIGMGADVHMGMFDDSKYVAEMRAEFADEPAPPPPKSSASLKRADANGDDAWDRMMKELNADLLDVKSLSALERIKVEYRKRVRDERWPRAWADALAEIFVEKTIDLEQTVLEAG